MTAGLPERYAVIEHVRGDGWFESFKVIDRCDGLGKLLHTATVELGKTAALTRKAAELLERTRDERVCIVLDTGCGKSHSVLWLVSEYVPGAISLRKLLDEDTGFDLEDAFVIAADIAAGLSFLETHNIAYSDLTTSEVLVWHQPGRGIRAKIDRVWVPYLCSELASEETSREAAASEGTAARVFSTIWAELSVCIRPAVADDVQADAIHRATEAIQRADNITGIANLFLESRREDSGPQLVPPAETDRDADIDAVLALDEATLDREYRAAADSDLPPAHIVREIASRAFVQEGAAITGMLVSAMNASAGEATMPQQLSLLDIGEDEDSGPRLLLVDADESRSKRHAHQLRSEGFIVRTVASASEAADLVDQEIFEAAAVWVSATDATQDAGIRELLRYNTRLPVLSVFPSTEEADVHRVLGRLTRLEVHRRHRKRAKSAQVEDVQLPFYSLPRTSG